MSIMMYDFGLHASASQYTTSMGIMFGDLFNHSRNNREIEWTLEERFFFPVPTVPLVEKLTGGRGS